MTTIAKHVGVAQAGEPCMDSGYGFKVCLTPRKSGSQVQVPLLDCNMFIGHNGVEEDVCQVKSWIVILFFTLLVIISLSILGNIGCCCWGCCQCNLKSRQRLPKTIEVHSSQ